MLILHRFTMHAQAVHRSSSAPDSLPVLGLEVRDGVRVCTVDTSALWIEHTHTTGPNFRVQAGSQS